MGHHHAGVAGLGLDDHAVVEHDDRHDDTRRSMEVVLGLNKNEYTVTYYRTLERYIVFLPHQAHRLAPSNDRAGGRCRSLPVPDAEASR
jgi:hypothetical protein